MNESSKRFVKKHMKSCRVFSDKKKFHNFYLKDHASGLICEFGVYKGSTINAMAKDFPDKQFYGFDSFDGLREDWRGSHKKGIFKVDFDSLKFEKNIKIYKGFFDKTIPVFLDNTSKNISFINIDCDLYSSTTEVLYGLKDRFTSETIFLFDELLGYNGFENHELKALKEFAKEFNLIIKYLGYRTDDKSKCVQVALKMEGL